MRAASTLASWSLAGPAVIGSLTYHQLPEEECLPPSRGARDENRNYFLLHEQRKESLPDGMPHNIFVLSCHLPEARAVRSSSLSVSLTPSQF